MYFEIINYMNTENTTDFTLELMQDCKEGNINTVKYYLTSPLLKNKPNINSVNEIYKYNFYTPLMMAIEGNHIEIVKYLLCSSELKKHANINQVCFDSRPEWGACALSIAASKGANDMVNFLLNSDDLIEKAKICPLITTLEIVSVHGKREIKEIEHICYGPLRSALLSDHIDTFDILLSQPELNNQPQLVQKIIADTLEDLFKNQKTKMFAYLLVNNYITITKKLKSQIEAINDYNESYYMVIKKIMDSIELKNGLDNHLDKKSKESNKPKI